ncbi:MAG TPA: LPS assembly protein LptD [Desulfobacterales bacterium]|nr:LPS assembly protein LptD [Desulfobacterales bacterium]
MSHLQNSRRLFQGCVDDYSTVPTGPEDPPFSSAVHTRLQTPSGFLKSTRICRTVIPWILLPLMVVLIFGHASAQDTSGLFQDDKNVPWHIVADEITYDDKTNVYTGRGRVVITKKNKNLSADYVRFDQKTMKVSADGHVVMNVGENILTGSRMEMNLDSETGTVYDGTIFLQENHFYIKGDKIQKVGEDSYTADKASVSSCDGDQPAWKITGRNLKITMEGYGVVKHAALWAKKVPVLYTPYLVFPAKLKRQSGLLAPQFGYDDRKGAVYLQPLYWAINESSDATFYPHYMSRRGAKLGAEYRYVLDEQSKGTLMVDFLDDRKVDDGSFGSDKWGFDGDDALRPNSDRYWLRAKHDQALPSGFFARLDIDYVSDQDYLPEFQYGYTGFDNTRAYFNKNFGRELNEYDNSVRLNRFNVNRNWSLYSFNADLRWYDDVINRRQSETDDTLQQLPAITFDGLKQKILTSPFYFDLKSEYTYFYSEDALRGHRGDVYPRFYLPYRFRNYFSLEPSVGVRETVWHFDKDEYSPSDKNTLHREMYDVKVDLSSEIFHMFNLNGEGVQRIKHTVKPQVTYEYIPEKDQSEYPLFDSLDQIERKNIVTYSLTNTLTSKSKMPTKNKDTLPTDKPHGDDRYEPPTHTYNQFCWFKLEQSYDIDKGNEDDPEPFSPINITLRIFPRRYFAIYADADWSHYDSAFRSRNIALNLWDPRGDTLFVSHRYNRDASESVYTDLHLKVSESLSVVAEYERDIFNGNDLKSGLGFLYETQCWSLYTKYLKEGDDQKIGFMIELYGIGGVGSK